MLSAYHLTDATPQKRAETCSVSSTAFARYSSSAPFFPALSMTLRRPERYAGGADAESTGAVSTAIFPSSMNSLPTGRPFSRPPWRLYLYRRCGWMAPDVMPENISRVFCRIHPATGWYRSSLNPHEIKDTAFVSLCT
ncbi:hypothetical protein KCP74_15390 [Salmonella enterica subsp. enterica]|nr:hypothetical protein KCP74_15390 [Salmonella enterica subsp. enterica]